MRGNLRQSSLADVLRHLYAERKNGVLHLSRAGTNRRIHFKKGVPIYADADDKPFSTRQQAEGLLYSLFTWTSGEFSFQDGEPSVESGSAFTTSPSAVILEGSRRIDDRPTLEYLTGGPSSVYACAQTSVLPLFTMKLHPSESAILAFARERERFTLRDLPMASSATTTVSAVNALVSVGLLEIVEKGTAPPPEAPEAPVASAPAPPPVKPRPVLEPPPTPQPVVAAPPSVPPIRPVRLAPLVETPSPPASSSSPREVAPVLEPAATPGAAGAPSEVEQLLETFEAKRTQTFVAPAPPPSTLPPPEVADAVAEDRPPPTEAPLPSPAVQSLESDSAPPAANEVGEPFESPLDATADSGLAGSPESAESMPVRALPTASPRPTAVTDAIASWIPRGRAAGIGTAILAFVVAAVVLGTWLSSRRDEGSPADSVVAADAAPSDDVAPLRPLEPLQDASSPEPPEADPEPTDAELFYAASVAFENGEYEQSRAELEVLLARQPDFGVARELLARIDRELAPKPRVEAPRAPKRTVEKAPEPAPAPPKPEPTPAPEKPAPPDPAALFDAARSALARSDLETMQAKLDELERLDPSYPGARRLRDDLVQRQWEKKLPLTLAVRHDHALGGCDGVLSLTLSGFSYRSKEHEWVWSFPEIAETERRDAKRLRLETRGRASFNFSLRGSLSDEDWTRHQAIARR